LKHNKTYKKTAAGSSFWLLQIEPSVRGDDLQPFVSPFTKTAGTTVRFLFPHDPACAVLPSED
jgi:hypothetical protein